MMKLCLIYNYAQHYRAKIFELISHEYDCNFVFGDSMDDVKKMDYSRLRGKIKETHTYRFIAGWYWQTGVIAQLFKDYDYYIILGETRALSTWLFCLLNRIIPLRKKIYVWSHGWYGKESKLESFIKKLEFKLPNGGSFLYGERARQLMIQEGFKPEQLFTIHNSLAYDQQVKIRKTLCLCTVFQEHFGNENPNLFFVGRLTPIKQLHMILDALAICNTKGYRYNMTFIGDGSEADNLRVKVETLNLQKQIWFYGSCYDERKLSSLIYNADLCVSPGNIGLTAIHSMVFGTPCITHDDFRYQMPEFEAIKDGVTGCFFIRNDVNDLARQIVTWLNSKDRERENVRRACMEIIDKEWNPYYQIKIFKNVINQ